jgi:hypothetical protein
MGAGVPFSNAGFFEEKGSARSLNVDPFCVNLVGDHQHRMEVLAENPSGSIVEEAGLSLLACFFLFPAKAGRLAHLPADRRASLYRKAAPDDL